MTAIGLEQFTVSPAFDPGEVEGCVRRYGAAVLPAWVDADTLGRLREEFHRVLDDRDDRFLYPISYAPGKAISIMREKIPAGRYDTLVSFFKHAKMRETAGRYVGHPCLLNYEIYATHEFRPGEKVAPAHFDKLWTLKFMVYLNDIERGQAAFGIIPASAGLARRRFREIFERHGLRYLAMDDPRYHAMANADVPPELGPVVDITGPAGTLIVFDTDTFHHADAVVEGRERQILRGHSGPAISYARVRAYSRQWWRGEKRFSRIDRVVDSIADRF